MKTELLHGTNAYATFKEVSKKVYRKNTLHRGTEGSIEKLLLDGKSAFHKHASIKMFIVRKEGDAVARFALIHDDKLPDYCQVSFFEALEGLEGLYNLIEESIRFHFPECTKVIVGLNGHLNYGAGILMSNFDEAPLFGFPYNPGYYASYFKELKMHKMVSYRFGMDKITEWSKNYPRSREIPGLKVRFMNKNFLARDVRIYTELNNLSFKDHPFWADRDPAEDLELFMPFRYMLDKANLLIAEVNGKPVGFFLWYPDFNQFVHSDRDLNLWDLIRYRLGWTPDTFRFTEIGILPEYQGSVVAQELIRRAVPYVNKQHFQFVEGGFIFEANRASIAFTKGIIYRSHGYVMDPHRTFAVFEKTIL